MSAAGDMAARRRLFERAVAAGISMEAARAEIARERWTATDVQLRAKRGGESPVRVIEDRAEDGGQPLAWWQR